MFKSSIRVFSIALLGSVVCISIASAECHIYEHGNYKGRSGIIQNNDWVKFYEENQDNGVMPRDVPNARVFRDLSWLNTLSSFRSSPNCDVVMYTTPDANQYHARYKGDTPNLGENNDKSASILCQCSISPNGNISDLTLTYNGYLPLLKASCLKGKSIVLTGVHNIDGQLQFGGTESSFQETCFNTRIDSSSGSPVLHASCMSSQGKLIESSISLVGTPALIDLNSRPGCAANSQ